MRKLFIEVLIFNFLTEVKILALRKDKKNKLTVQPSERKGELTTQRPMDLWNEMDKMFDDFRSNFDDLFWLWRGTNSMTAMTSYRSPPMDIADHGDHYEMHVEMPGIPKDDINVEVTPNTIEISAQHDESKEHKDKNWLRRERSTTSFYRALEVPEEVKTDKVDAELSDGVLTLKLPKMEPKPEYKAKKINIK
jgi:HSP20 family protein